MVDDRTSRRRRSINSIAQAYRESQEVMSICLSLGLLVGGGYWVDLEFGFKPIFTVVGVVLGFVTAGFSLRRMLEKSDRRSRQRRESERPEKRDKPE